MNIPAIIHNTTEQYCYPINQEEVKIKLQTGKEVETVKIIHGDPFSGGIMGGNWKWDGESTDVIYSVELAYSKIYEVTLRPKCKRLKYYFEISSKEETVYLLEDKVYTKEEFEKFGPNFCFTFPWLNNSDVNETPSWVNNTIWYQIFPDRFCNSNLHEQPEINWHDKKVTNKEFYGGNIQGIISKLDYLHNLGINGIYLTPVFSANTVHKYDTKDYFKIDEQFGTLEDLKELVTKAHEYKIKIMLDAVFNHSGDSFAPWLDVVENKEKSKYYDWFMINDLENFDPGIDPHDGEFYTFAFTRHMPKLNTNNLEVQEYLIDVAKYWIKECDIDGWRFDVANEISHNFIKKLHIELKALKPEIYILGEIWHNSFNWLRGDEYDSVMNYPLTGAINNFFNDENLDNKEFMYNVNRCYSTYHDTTNNAIFNLLDSHDTARISTTSNSYNTVIQKLACMFSMQGTTCIYYGTEISLEGEHDPDCRRLMPWSKIDNNEYDKKINIIKNLINLRKENEALRFGNIAFFYNYSDRVIEFNKYSDTQEIKVILNASTQDIEIDYDFEILFSNNYEENILKTEGVLILKIK